MTRADLIHTTGNLLHDALGFLDYRIASPVSSWLMYKRIAIRDWQEKNHACCVRHGYRKDLP
jgi:hypothetical protein